MTNQLDIFNQQLVQIPSVESANSFTTLDEIFEDFNLIRHQVINGEHRFVLNDFAEHVAKTNQPSRYLAEMSDSLKKKGFNLVEMTDKLKFTANNGKDYNLKCVNGQTLLRICQEINSPRFEGLRQWLSSIGWRELKELKDPSLTVNRAINNYEKKGYDLQWISKRVGGILKRKGYTEAIRLSGCLLPQYAEYTDIYQTKLLGCKTSVYKKIHGLKPKATVRDFLNAVDLDVLHVIESYGERRIQQMDHTTHEKHLETAHKMADKIDKLRELLTD